MGLAAVIVAAVFALWLVSGGWSRRGPTSQALRDLKDHQPENVEEKDRDSRT